ncbi:pyroglutamyl-peptidase I [Gemella palaticanis]|uniref:Pyrrolidone-carboxylate peptidase n=2 Tax=Gemelliphila palaticanis TaxID=81950 RepID=A0ABX2T1C5_9BACL|nr:pyroglutamyl-peptidase I [Gemella palaticanis]MBF0715528.1 pyroglutamyl-peptidase I [Gemella palaticanis]NYS47458.1 pyroglutamyl-peptidase I [Gemella palaticanis]
MKVLITGFDPFNNSTINPSAEAIKLLPDFLGNVEVIKKIIPTVFNKSFDILKEHIENNKPDIVICVGQAGGRSKVTIERVAINIDDAPIKDNDGNIPVDKKIVEDGETAYFSTLPIKAIVNKLNIDSIPADISNSAGTFVCNHIMYQSLHYAKVKNHSFKTGFIHIPYIPEQTVDMKNVASMELNIIVDALEKAILVCTEYFNKDDIYLVAGKDA